MRCIFILNGTVNLSRQKEKITPLIDGIKRHWVLCRNLLCFVRIGKILVGEGEFKFYIDGDEDFPTITSTGAEDYFGGAWAFHKKNFGERAYAQNFNTLFMGYPFSI